MKKFWKGLSGVALAAMMLVSGASCNFFKSEPVKELVDKIFGDIPGVDLHTHMLEKQDAVEATCTQAGTDAYYLCTDPDCNKMFSDLNGENEIYAPVITEKKSHTLSKTLAKDATCLDMGYEAYYTCTSCRKMFSDEAAQNEIFAPKQTGLANHTLVKVDAKAATETTSGNTEYYTCSVCKKLFSDATGKNETTLSDVYIEPTAELNWVSMTDVTDAVAPTYSNGVTTFNTWNNSAYLENVFVDENGNSLVGAYNPANANTEYTYSMNIKAGGTFNLVLFANETTKTLYSDADLPSGEKPKFGLYIRFDATDSETNVKLQAVLGNSKPDDGIKAKGASTFAFDGATENNVRLVVERYSEDKVILHIWVNGKEIHFNKTSTKGVDTCGFNFRTEWDRTDPINGIGESYDDKGTAYSTISCSRGLDDGIGFGAGLAVAVIGNVASNAMTGEGRAPVVLSNLSVTKTGEQVVHTHSLTLMDGVAATCTTEGYQAYYTCACGKLFSDAEATNPIAAPIVIPASHELTYTAEVPATETDEGRKEYWACGVCGKLFADENGSVETTLDALVIQPSAHEHSMTHTAAVEATALKDGNVEYWYCAGCESYYLDETGEQAVSLNQTVVNVWAPMADIQDATAVVANGTASFTGLNSSSYVDNMFVAGLAGGYDPSVANTEYTLTAKFKTTGVFSFVLFADEITTSTITASNVKDDVMDKLGFFISFEPATSDDNYNVKLKAGVGNSYTGNWSYGSKGKALANELYLDGSKENTLKVTIERYSEDKLILQITVNGQLLEFILTSNKGPGLCGFNLRTEWNRTDLVNGIGSAYTSSKGTPYPTISISRGLDDGVGLGNGLGVSVADGVTVTISELSVAKTKDQVVHVHAGTLVAKEDATCTQNGHEAYYTCVCGKLFSDEACENEIEAPVVIYAKHSLTSVEAANSSCTVAGYEAHYKCGVCGKLFSDAEAANEIEAPVAKELAAHTLTNTGAKEATETEDGNIEYWTCGVCGKLFLDANGERETTLAEVTLPAVGHTHTAIPVAEQAASCTQDGYKAHYTCRCGLLFSDTACENVIEAPEVLPASHKTEYVEATTATALQDGYAEHWYCAACDTWFADREATQVVNAEDLAISAWSALKDIEESTDVVANGTATFTGINSNSYVDDMFVAGLAGGYDPSVANTEYTLTAKFKTTGVFSFVLFADENTTSEYTEDNIIDNVAQKLGFYLRFDMPTTSDNNNIKLLAAVGNGTSSKPATKGVKAKALGTVYFDGVTENVVKIKIERYSEDILIIHVNVNNEDISFKKTSTAGADVCGFHLRTAWDRTDLFTGIGEPYTAKSKAYPTVGLVRGLDDGVGLGNGLGVSLKDGVTVTISELSVAKTKDQVVHVHAGTLVAKEDATCTQNGHEAYYTCVCGKLFSDEACEKEIEAPVVIYAKHSLTSVEAANSSCTVAGYEAHYKCGVCGKLFSDAEAANEIESPVVKDLAAHSLTKTDGVDATETEAGCEAYWTCGVCTKIFSDENGVNETTLENLVIPALGHTHTMSYVAAKEASCTEDGNVAYYTCSGCGKNYEEETAENEIENVVIVASHTMTHIEAVEETALKDGNVEYWYCSACDTYFANADATETLSADELVIPAWTWNYLKDVTDGVSPTVANGTATFTGENSSSYVANVFEDGVAGAYDASAANIEYTLTVKFKTTGKFILTLFADENTTCDYTSSNISSSVADKLGFMIVFEPTKTDDNNNVKLKAAVGNGTSSKAATTGAKAKALASSLSFDGVTENVVTITVERYSADKIMLEISVNGEELSFKKTSTAGADVCGFHLRTAWDRTDLSTGIGDPYTAKSNAYPTVGLVRGLDDGVGLGDGVAVSVTDGVTVILSEFSVAITGTQVVA